VDKDRWPMVKEIRQRIMCEAYDLADRDDSEGYNAIKVMCSEVLELIDKLIDKLIEQAEHAPICAHGVSKIKSDFCNQAEQAQPFGYFRYDLRLDAWVQNRAGITGTPFYTAPPQRQPLTDEEIRAVYGNDLQYRDGDYMRFARAIEAAHGIKGENNGTR
jgi:hypothetical protein